MTGAAGYLSLFASAFLAATILPLQSEVLLAGLQLGGNHSSAALVAVATAGNVLGALVNWILGRYFLHFRDRRWFPISPRMLDRAIGWYQRWGVWSLLLAWTPFLGDPLTLVAGVLRTGFWTFLVLVTVGKAGRYVLVVYLVGPAA